MNKPRTPTQKSCAFCGTGFLTQSSIKQFCSAECRVKDIAAGFHDPDVCWNWPKSLNPQTGYGQLSTWQDGKRVLLTTHRVSYTAFHGGIPEGLSVLHKCDNRRCINPAHLYAGTQADNMHDCISRDRYAKTHKPPAIIWQKQFPERVKRGAEHPVAIDPSCMPRGEKHPGSKITEADVLEIRNSKETGIAMAKKFGLTPSTVSSIRTRQIWKHVL